jgi:hypothetical protein
MLAKASAQKFGLQSFELRLADPKSLSVVSYTYAHSCVWKSWKELWKKVT